MYMTRLRALSPRQRDIKIQVRVSRMWRPKLFYAENQFDGLHCILVDSEGDAIESLVKEINYDFVVSKIELGCIYEITQFYTTTSKSTFQVVPSDTSIEFNGRTIFQKMVDVCPTIPLHRFFSIDYSQVSSRLNHDVVLTDVLGHIVAVQNLERILVRNANMVTKCELRLQNIRGDELQITLWADIAEAFNPEILQQLPPPVLAVFTSLKVQEFHGQIVLSNTPATCTFINPPIPEFEAYKPFFSTMTSPLIILPPSTTAQVIGHSLHQAKHINLATLNILDPAKSTDDHILCTATIKHFDTHKEWYYHSCPICHKIMKAAPNTHDLICTTHNKPQQPSVPWFKVGLILEDATDETDAIIVGRVAEQLFGISCHELVVNKQIRAQHPFPEATLRLKGQVRTFELRFGTAKSRSNEKDVVIHAIIDDQSSIPESSSQSVEQKPMETTSKAVATSTFTSITRSADSVDPFLLTVSEESSKKRKSDITPMQSRAQAESPTASTEAKSDTDSPQLKHKPTSRKRTL